MDKWILIFISQLMVVRVVSANEENQLDFYCNKYATDITNSYQVMKSVNNIQVKIRKVLIRDVLSHMEYDSYYEKSRFKDLKINACRNYLPLRTSISDELKNKKALTIDFISNYTVSTQDVVNPDTFIAFDQEARLVSNEVKSLAKNLLLQYIAVLSNTSLFDIVNGKSHTYKTQKVYGFYTNDYETWYRDSNIQM
ncbi:hypothetical protein [Litoribacillus peritrichatus]